MSYLVIVASEYFSTGPKSLGVFKTVQEAQKIAWTNTPNDKWKCYIYDINRNEVEVDMLGNIIDK
jgi:hypothetical protein